MMTDAFRDAIAAQGLTPPDRIEPGRFMRFPGDGKKRGNTAGYCLLFPDLLGGIFGDWSTGLDMNWQAPRDKPLSHHESQKVYKQRADAREERDRIRKQQHAVAAKGAQAIWDASEPAPEDHPYLTKKGIRAHGVRVYDGPLVIRDMRCDGALLIPLREDDDLRTLQFIDETGEKRFLFGASTKGHYFTIGEPAGTLCIAEGFATAATIHEATGHAVAAAMDAGNLLAVAKALRARYPDQTIVICADDDHKTEGNPGLAQARAAAAAIGGHVAIPEFGPDRSDAQTDFNDKRDAEAIKRAVSAATRSEGARTHPKPSEGYGGAEVELVSGDSVNIQAINWLWNGFFARGKVHIIAGAPGTGKTTLALKLSATLTQGAAWPDGSPSTTGDVLIWSGEDSAEDTLAPRLIAMGADMRRIHFVGAVRQGNEPIPFDPAHHFDALARAAARLPNLRLMVVDPIVSAVAGDSNKNAEVRRGLQPLVTFAENAHCALVGISHFTKGTQGRDPLERVTGSLGFGAVARVVFGTAKLPEEQGGGRVFVRVKSNIGPDGGGFNYGLCQAELGGQHVGITTSRVEWGTAVEGSARDILHVADQQDDAGGGEKPHEFLAAMLSAGPRPATEIMRDAQAHGFSQSQMHRAKDKLKVEVGKVGFNNSKWHWFLPKMTPEGDEGNEQFLSLSSTSSRGDRHLRKGPEDVEDDGVLCPQSSPPSPSSSASQSESEVL